MLYKIVHDKDVFELNPGLLAVPAYAELEDKQMKYIILLCDPSRDNPVRTLSGKRRMEEALRIAGYPLESDGKRLNKNARDIMAGNKPRINAAIEEFKRTHYNEDQETFDSIVSQISEIREFLKSDKTVPMTTSKGVIIKDEEGNEIREIDPKKLKLAIDSGKSLPDLIDAKNKLQEKLGLNQDTKFVGVVPTATDLEELSEDQQNLSAIDQHWLAVANQEKQQG